MIQTVRSVQLGEARHGCTLCLLADTQSDAAPVYAVAVRLNNFIGHWPSTHLVTAERWTDANLRRVLVWRPAAEAETEFGDRLASFPLSAAAGVAWIIDLSRV